jgi:hypothetical protein
MRLLLTSVEQAMTQMQFDVRSVINAPSGGNVRDMHRTVFENMTTRFDNSISEAAIVGFAEIRLRVQVARVFCEGSLNNWK